MGDLTGRWRCRLSTRLQKWEYRALVLTAGWLRGAGATWAWTHWWVTRTPKMRGQSQIRMHGRRVTVNTGFAYPAFMRRWPRYNSPLVDLVTAVRSRHQGPLTVVDVGAAVGDTVLLLVDRADGDDDRYVCVEPDAEFRAYLRTNVAHLPHVEIHADMLSDSDGKVPAPVRTHSGSASAQGQTTVRATTLDSIIANRHVDVVKIDTDGFDGKVLGGAEATLEGSTPAVIFEWHPILYRACGQSVTVPFEVLARHGYSTFVWFTKHGELSHIESPQDLVRTADLARLCLEDQGPEPDWHYDVVALPAHLEEAASDLAAAAQRGVR